MLNTNQPLTRERVGNHVGYRLAVADQPAEHGTYLVKLDDKGDWQFVDTLEKPLSFDDLKSGYGVWQDKEIKKGHVFKKTVRHFDNEIQPDEVQSFAQSSEPVKVPTGGGIFFQNYTVFQMQDAHIDVQPAPTLLESWQQLS